MGIFSFTLFCITCALFLDTTAGRQDLLVVGVVQFFFDLDRRTLEGIRKEKCDAEFETLSFVEINQWISPFP